MTVIPLIKVGVLIGHSNGNIVEAESKILRTDENLDGFPPVSCFRFRRRERMNESDDISSSHWQGLSRAAEPADQ